MEKKPDLTATCH